MTAPASLRVAEELLNSCALLISGGIATGEGTLSIATAIITLAQDAARREDAEWCEERRDLLLGGEYDTKDDPLTSERALQLVASHLRAMMVKP